MPLLQSPAPLAARSKDFAPRYTPVPIIGKKRPSPEQDQNRESSRPRSSSSITSSSGSDGSSIINGYSNGNTNGVRQPPGYDPSNQTASRVKPHASQHPYTLPQPQPHRYTPHYRNLQVSVVIPPTNPPANAVKYNYVEGVEPSQTRIRVYSNPDLFIVNAIDTATLPKNFKFVPDYVFVGGTARIPVEARSGCTCRLDNGRNIGCEYLHECECMEDVALTADHKRMGFPYVAVGDRKGCLRDIWLRTRFVVYECSPLCSCVTWCRNKNVQHGRTLPLEIFRTRDRGWGLRSTRDIRKGQFVDTYRGEVITSREADRREEVARNNKDSYLFSLDKFADQVANEEDLFVVDGEFMGGPTRFINHSCDPNCAIYCVSTTRGDARVYELAFFALEEIPAGTELTFDYLGEDSSEDTSTKDARKVKGMEAEKGKLATKCLCRSPNCRGFLWL